MTDKRTEEHRGTLSRRGFSLGLLAALATAAVTLPSEAQERRGATRRIRDVERRDVAEPGRRTSTFADDEGRRGSQRGIRDVERRSTASRPRRSRTCSYQPRRCL